jgi:hypothetical protein
LLLVAGIVVSSWIARTRQPREAEARAATSFSATTSWHRLVQSTQPDRDTKAGSGSDVRTALDRAAARVQESSTISRCSSLDTETIGRTQEDLGLYPEAISQLERALVIASSHAW